MRTLSFVLFLFTSQLCMGQSSGFMEFETREIDLGTITKGEVIDTAFVFTNISSEDLKIDIVDACECTTLDWTRTTIKPGKKGKISISFDSAKKDIVETISVDITLWNNDPKTGGPVMDGVSYTYDFR